MHEEKNPGHPLPQSLPVLLQYVKGAVLRCFPLFRPQLVRLHATAIVFVS